MQRSKCVVCDSTEFEELITIKDFPVYMGVSYDYDFKYEDMTYMICKSCHCIQLKNLVPLDVLYAHNHNVEVVGKTWHGHNRKFIDFMYESHIKNKFIDGSDINYVVEIGDPQYKMAKAADGIIDYKKWTIIEPCSPETYPDRVEYITDVVDENFDVSQIDLVDTVVMSHSLEHMYDPKCVLRKINTMLKHDGQLFISVPDTDQLIVNSTMPPFGMHFEHTFASTEYYIKLLLQNTGFKITNSYNYNNHSVFYACTKYDTRRYAVKLNRIVRTCGIEEGSIQSKNLFIYGAHFPAQLILKQSEFNLESKCIGVLDNAKSKQGKYLYGTSLMVYPPEKIADYEDVQVIVKMGPYTDEIIERLTALNMGVKICI